MVLMEDSLKKSQKEVSNQSSPAPLHPKTTSPTPTPIEGEMAQRETTGTRG